jgi:tRNA splicing endonuclease
MDVILVFNQTYPALYKRNPELCHSEYLVCIVNSNSNTSISDISAKSRCANQVKKRLLIAYVAIPNSITFESEIPIWDIELTRWQPES